MWGVGYDVGMLLCMLDMVSDIVLVLTLHSMMDMLLCIRLYTILVWAGLYDTGGGVVYVVSMVLHMLLAMEVDMVCWVCCCMSRGVYGP